jgi:drug/metabolite transporter (DMT)-like permease
MPIASDLLGILFALTSALVWGSGDFTGGFATRKSNQYVVLVISAFSGLVVLILAALVWREAFPSARGMLWAALGGISGALGIAAFYRALSLAHTAIVAPTAAVIGAVLPVVVSIFIAGWPSGVQLLGFALALAGIWLVSTAPTGGRRISRQGFVLACLGGTGFGGFFVFLGLVDPGKIFTPLIIARSMTLSVGLILVALQRLRLPSITSNRLALLAGVLDAGGNLFYVLAKQFTRLDVAAVLSSLYPASTVFLASLLLKEKVSRYQWVGVLLCLGAIALITA